MKNLTLIFAFVFATFVGANAQAPAAASPVAPPNPNGPEMSFEKETHDYGNIKQGAEGSYEFKFTNIGKEPLIISNAKGSCGCTVPNWPKVPIKPGESGVIKVTYDTKRVGPINKTVTIESNAKTPTRTLKIAGNVEAVPTEETMPVKAPTLGVPVD